MVRRDWGDGLLDCSLDSLTRHLATVGSISKMERAKAFGRRGATCAPRSSGGAAIPTSNGDGHYQNQLPHVANLWIL